MAKISKSQFINSSLWKIVEQFSTKGVSLIFSVILARLISPDAYGILSLTVVFTNLSDILIDGGFSTALIRKKEVDDCDYSCVTVVSCSIALVLYVALYLASPLISAYYGEAQLIPVLRVIGLVLFIQAFSAVRNAMVNRNLQFKLLFQCNFLSTIISGVIGVAAALFGAEVWALVIQRLLQLALSTVFLFFRLKWKVKFRFSFSRMKEILSFSIGVISSSMLNYLGSSVYSLVVGKQYSLTDLAYSDRGTQLPTQVSLYTFGAMSSVLLPTLSSYQSEIERVKQIVRKVVQMTSYLIAPLMVGLAMVSRELILILFKEPWLPAVPIMQANCIYYFATPFMLIFVQVFFALGHSSARVKTETVRIVLQTAGVFLFGIILRFTIYQLAYVVAAVAVISAFVTYLFARPMIRYSLTELIKDMYKPVIAAGLMGVLLFVVQGAVSRYISSSAYVLLMAKTFLGALFYLVMSVFLRLPGFHEIRNVLKNVRRKK